MVDGQVGFVLPASGTQGGRHLNLHRLAPFLCAQRNRVRSAPAPRSAAVLEQTDRALPSPALSRARSGTPLRTTSSSTRSRRRRNSPAVPLRKDARTNSMREGAQQHAAVDASAHSLLSSRLSTYRGATSKRSIEMEELRLLTAQATQQEYLTERGVQEISDILVDVVTDSDSDNNQRALDGASSAREALVVAHMRLVVRMARKCAGYFRLPLTDLVQEGCLGLMHAARKFDPSRGVSFAAYASPWVMHYMRRAEQNQAGMIRLPVHVFEKRSAIQQIAKILAHELGRAPTVSEIAERLETPLDESLIRSTLENTFDVHSLDSPLFFHLQTGDGGFASASSNSSAGANVQVSEQDLPDMRVLEQERSELLGRFLRAQLTEKEHAALCMRYGLDGHARPHSVTEVAIAQGVSLPAVTQTLARATRKLQACRESLQTTIG